MLPLWKSRTVVNDAWHEHDKATAVLVTFLRCAKCTMPVFEGMVAILTWRITVSFTGWGTLVSKRVIIRLHQLHHGSQVNQGYFQHAASALLHQFQP
jgi:hypothetical protein